MISSFEMNYVKGKRGKKKDQTSYPYLRTFVEFSCLTKQTTIRLHFITPCSSASSLPVNAGTKFCLAIETSVMDNRNNPNWEEHKNQDPRQKGTGSKEDVNSLKPEDRLKDGTNDLQNGDQDPSSENSNKPSPGRGQSS
jgi:hypothetical protein